MTKRILIPGAATWSLQPARIQERGVGDVPPPPQSVRRCVSGCAGSTAPVCPALGTPQPLPWDPGGRAYTNTGSHSPDGTQPQQQCKPPFQQSSRGQNRGVQRGSCRTWSSSTLPRSLATATSGRASRWRLESPTAGTSHSLSIFKNQDRYT